MKKWLTLLLLCCSLFTAKAQLNDYDTNIAHFFEHLDFGEVTTGLLLERARPFTVVDSFDGIHLSPLNKMDINKFGALYATLYGAAFDSTAWLPHPDAYMDVRDSLEHGDTVPLAIFHYDYHRFREDAVSLELLEIVDSQLYDVANRPESPYLLQKAFGITPLLNDVDTLDISFSLPDSLVFSNSDSIHLFWIDLDDGNGYQALGFGQAIAANYEEEGEKVLKFRIKLNNGDTLYSHAVFSVTGTGINNRGYSAVPDTTITIPGTTAHDGATLQILYSCTGKVMRKPLLYVEGFQLGKKNQNYEFLKGPDRLLKPVPGGSENFEDIIMREGYDLIYLDFTHNTDFMRRNAQVVKAAINAINAMKAANGSNEKIIVIGASMGGVVSKYALLEMEQAEQDHQVKTLITLDSPLRGANFPVGLQYGVIHAANTQASNPGGNISIPLTLFIPALYDLQQKTGEGFLQEALIYNLFAMPTAIGTIPNNPSGADMTTQTHIDFYSDLAAMGSLQHCEFVSLSNGSANGVGQGFSPGSLLVYTSPLSSEILEWATGLDEALFYGIEIQSWFHLTGVSAEIAAYALPDSITATVYDANTFVIFFGIPINISNVEGKVHDTAPYDNAPGGYVPIPLEDIPSFVNIVQPNICLVPTVSSLDVPAPANNNLYLVLSNVDSVVMAGLSLMDRYDASTDASIGGLENQEHATWNSSNIGFLVAELASQDSLVTLPFDPLAMELVLDDSTYNYGDAEGLFKPANPNQIRHTPHQLSQSLRVEGDGKLWVNRDDRISFTHVTENPYNTTNSHFDLYIQGRSGCSLGGLDLYIVDGAEMKIGQGAAYNIHIQGELEIKGEFTFGEAMFRCCIF